MTNFPPLKKSPPPGVDPGWPTSKQRIKLIIIIIIIIIIYRPVRLQNFFYVLPTHREATTTKDTSCTVSQGTVPLNAHWIWGWTTVPVLRFIQSIPVETLNLWDLNYADWQCLHSGQLWAKRPKQFDKISNFPPPPPPPPPTLFFYMGKKKL